MKRALLAAAVVILAAGFWVGYRQYQEYYLSPTVKRLLIAAMDPHSTSEDVKIYVRQARLEVRTERDRNTLAKYEEARALLTAFGFPFTK